MNALLIIGVDVGGDSQFDWIGPGDVAIPPVEWTLPWIKMATMYTPVCGGVWKGLKPPAPHQLWEYIFTWYIFDFFYIHIYVYTYKRRVEKAVSIRRDREGWGGEIIKRNSWMAYSLFFYIDLFKSCAFLFLYSFYFFFTLMCLYGMKCGNAATVEKSLLIRFFKPVVEGGRR